MYRRGDNSRTIIISVAVAVALILLVGVYLTFFYSKSCDTQECFIKAMDKCSRVSFANAQDSVKWQYNIRGSMDGACVIDVTALFIDTEDNETKTLEGKSMVCSIPFEISGTFFPESRLEYCHGLFKEGLQEILLKRINEYVVQNLEGIDMAISEVA